MLAFNAGISISNQLPPSPSIFAIRAIQLRLQYGSDAIPHALDRLW